MERSHSLSTTENSLARDPLTISMEQVIYKAYLPLLVNTTDEAMRREALGHLLDHCHMSVEEILSDLDQSSGRVNFEKDKVSKACAFVREAMPLVQQDLF